MKLKGISNYISRLGFLGLAMMVLSVVAPRPAAAQDLIEYGLIFQQIETAVVVAIDCEVDGFAVQINQGDLKRVMSNLAMLGFGLIEGADFRGLRRQDFIDASGTKMLTADCGPLFTIGGTVP